MSGMCSLAGNISFVIDLPADWWATHSGAPAVNAGLDVSTPSETIHPS